MIWRWLFLISIFALQTTALASNKEVTNLTFTGANSVNSKNNSSEVSSKYDSSIQHQKALAANLDNKKNFWLADKKILARFYQNLTAKTQGAVIILVPQFGMSRSSNLLNSLRQELQKYGWSIMVITLNSPINNHKKYLDQSTIAINEALAELSKQNHQRVNMIAAGSSALDAIHFIGSSKRGEVKELILFSAQFNYDTQQQLQQYMFKLQQIPILDIIPYSTRHSDIEKAKLRKEIAKIASGKYRQIQVLMPAISIGDSPGLVHTIVDFLKQKNKK